MPRRSGYGGRRGGLIGAPIRSAGISVPVRPPQQPGLFGQMAATAAGVAVGSTLGHAAAGALVGVGGKAPDNAHELNTVPSENVNANPCMQYITQFLDCIQKNDDISVCQGLCDTLKDCKLRYGLP